jgi:outer membrane protein OmpA-like peptidoglycan-associated protein
LAKEAAQIEEKRRKAEAARNAEEERRKVEAARIAEAERRKAEAARIAKEEHLTEATRRTARQEDDRKACRNIAALEIRGYQGDRAELPSGAAGQLAGIARSLKGNRCRVRIAGYASMDMFLLLTADKVRPAVERIAMARATAVASELKRLGVALDQITTVSVIGGSQRVRVTVQ